MKKGGVRKQRVSKNKGLLRYHIYFYHNVKDEVPSSINCLTFLASGDVVTGDSSGNLLIWDRDATDAFTCRYSIQAHQVRHFRYSDSITIL